MVFIGEESSKRRVNAYIPKSIFMAYYIMFLWIPEGDETRSKVTGNFLVNALHAFHRFNRRYHVKKCALYLRKYGMFVLESKNALELSWIIFHLLRTNSDAIIAGRLECGWDPENVIPREF